MTALLGEHPGNVGSFLTHDKCISVFKSAFPFILHFQSHRSRRKEMATVLLLPVVK